MRPISTELLIKTAHLGDDRLSAHKGTIHAGRVPGDLQELRLRMEGSSQAHEVRPLRLKTGSITSTEIYPALAPIGSRISGGTERNWRLRRSWNGFKHLGSSWPRRGPFVLIKDVLLHRLHVRDHTRHLFLPRPNLVHPTPLPPLIGHHNLCNPTL